MSTTRHPMYMHRRLMRLMAQEQQLEQRQQLRLTLAALLQHAQQLAALFGPPLAEGPAAALDNANPLGEAVDQASAPAALWAHLRTRLH